AGLRNVIASSGTAFTELQARLLGRFSKNVVVNFDPDTAGAKATERTLGLLVEEEFNIKVLTLEPGFDPDLYVRRKGVQAYGEALRGSQKYFDYLIERARNQFPVRSPEGKVKAVNYLLPHIQRVPNRIARDELSQEIAQKLGIDSAVLRQELRHVASQRTASTVKAAAESQITEAERILIRALASTNANSSGDQAEFDPTAFSARRESDGSRYAREILQAENLHRGLACESLVDALLNASPETSDAMEIECSEPERATLAAILLKEEEELTLEQVEGAIRALRRIHLRRQLEELQRLLKQPGLADDRTRMRDLLRQMEQVSRALRDPALAEEGLRSMLEKQKTA
ncbi:MAG TPA: toprim domain-containing protein, partial [Candidatus Binatia bacterium]|nr:toprim domain-containing protein [Candidatus Binatia bacterium]